MNFARRQGFVSAAVFCVILFALVSVDERVRERFETLSVQDGQTGLSGLSGLGDAVMTAARHQSIENAPLLIFASVGAVLVLFMVKT
jgi:hypothetical protein